MEYDVLEQLRRSGLMDTERKLREASDVSAKLDQLTGLDSRILEACDISGAVEKLTKPFRDLNEQFASTVEQLRARIDSAMLPLADETERLRDLLKQYDLRLKFPHLPLPEIPRVPIFELSDIALRPFEPPQFPLPPLMPGWYGENFDVERQDARRPARFVDTDNDTVDTEPTKRRPARFVDTDG